MVKTHGGLMDRRGDKKVFSFCPYSLFLGILFLVISFVLLGIDSPSYGGIYRYIDENGNYYFTNCPRDSKYELYIREKGDFVSVRGDPDQYDPMIEEFSEKYGIESALVKAVIRAESGFNSYAVSRKGAKGLMQLMPETFGDNLALSLAAYNAGKEAVIQNRSVPPYDETRNFVREVLRYYESYKH
jgi:hypothetical protein